VSGYSGISGVSGFSGWSGYSGGIDPNRRVSSKIYVFSTKTGKKVFEGFGYPTLTPGSSISMGFPDGSVVYPTSAYYKISGNEYRTNTGIAIIAENLKKK
jgi:hypothetical protein